VLLAPGARAASVQRLARTRANGPDVPQIGLVTVTPAAGRSVADTLGALRALPGVASAQSEHRLSLRATPDDPALTTPETTPGTAPGTPLEWWPVREGFPRAWSHTRGMGARVGIIDTGVDAGHPELRGKIAAAVDRDETAGHGPATIDEMGHGTHVSSLACAATDDGVTLAGAGWGCRIVIVKSDLTDGSIAASIVDAVDHGARAINMSFGDDSRAPTPAAIEKAISYAVGHNVVLVAAAADENTTEQGYPANALQPAGTGPDLARGLGLSVTAADHTDARASFAGRGSEISLAAYGTYDSTDSALSPSPPAGPVGLFGAFPRARTEIESDPLFPCGCRIGSSPYAYLAGTSMAAPQVTATAALVRTLNPDLTAAQVVRLLKATARRAAGAGWGPELGWGILDAGAALDAAARMDRRPPRVRVQVRRRSGGFLLRYSGSDAAPRGVRRAGLRSVAFFARTDGGRSRRLAVRADRRPVTFRARRGRSYAFYALGTDRAGNRQRRPTFTLRARG